MLKDFYSLVKVPEEEQMRFEKNVLIVLPRKEHDVGPVLGRLGLTRFEVAVTWPKEGVDLLAEICAAEPKLIFQADESVSRKFPVIKGDQDVDEAILAKVREVTSDAFVGLHHHDEFSIKDGLGTVEQLTKLLKAQRRSFCAVTNHGSVGVWIKQYNACKKSGLKAIFGMEAYVSNYRGDDPEQKKAHRSANHLVLLARTKEGFDNIIRIHNDAQLNGFYYSPRANREAFEKWGRGVVASSACMAGELPRALMEGDKAKALEIWEFYSKVFDRFYVEIQIIEFEEQREANRRLIEFAREVGAPLLLTCDSHYLEPEQSETHDLLMCMRQGKTVLDRMDDKEDVWNFDVKNLYYRDADSMWEVFASGYVDVSGKQMPPFIDDVFTQEVFLEAMANTRALAVESEEIVLDSTVKLPKLYPDGQRVLREKMLKGFEALGLKEKIETVYGKKGSVKRLKEYEDRLEHEFAVITKLGWTDYFLVMEKIIADATEKYGEWAVGYGRGSAAGSLVSYCLRLTDVDPLEWGLLFERFIDEGRPDPPDIDTDFDPRIRGWVKKHVVELFGEDNVCSIGTYQTYRTRAVILDVARVLGLDLGEAAMVTKKIDPLRSFEDEDGEDTKVDKLDFDELEDHYPELRAYFAAHGDVKRHAEILRNQVKNMNMHAGGVIISDSSLKDRIPVLYDKPSNEDRQVVSAWAESGNASELSAVGLVKYDILGLKNLPVISDCIAMIEKTTGNRLNRKDIPIDDHASIKMESKTDLVGIFQLENPSTKPIADAVEVESLEDVAALTSLIRPGPKDKDMHMMYARRKHGEPYDMPEFMKKMLASTYGVLTYQEQAMQISRELCGFTAPEANKLRKAIGKKLKELMAEQKAKFISRAQARVDAGDITAKEVKEIFDLIESFAGYGFNKSHAVCYSAISTVQMWLKNNFFTEYVTALINNTKLGKEKHGSENILVDYVNYARRRGKIVLGPDVNKSGEEFRIENGKIRFSIGHVKNVASSAGVIVSFAPFTSVQDFYDRVKAELTGAKGKKTLRRPNKKVVESLIAAGAFDSFGTRNEVMTQYYKARGEKVLPEDKTDEQWEEAEKEVIGLCLSSPPLCEVYKNTLASNPMWKRISELKGEDKKRVTVFGMVDRITPATSKAGNQRYDVVITDGIDSFRFMVFTGSMEYFRDTFKPGYVGAIPLNKFDEGDNRFFDDRGVATVVDKIVARPKKAVRTILRALSDGSSLYREAGDKDEWKIGIALSPEKEGLVSNSQDSHLSYLLELGDWIGDRLRVAGDMRSIYAKASSIPSKDVFDEIAAMASGYAPREKHVESLFSLVYAVMVAQENDKKTKLGKRMMIVAMLLVLEQDMSPAEVANNLAGKSVKDIEKMAKDMEIQ